MDQLVHRGAAWSSGALGRFRALWVGAVGRAGFQLRSGAFWAVLERSGALWGALGCSGALWGVQRHGVCGIYSTSGTTCPFVLVFAIHFGGPHK